MLTEAKKNLRLMGKYFQYNLSAVMEYRVSFLVQVFGMMINNASFIFFWWIAFTQLNTIAGYGFQDVMFIWALASSSFGFAFILFGNISNLSNLIINGELDSYLLQPKDVYFNVMCSRSIISAWGDLLYGIILMFVAFGFDPLKLVLFTLFILLGGMLMASLLITAHSLTFYTGNANAIARLVTEFMISFSIYPEGIFRGAVRLILFSLIPAGFVTFIPLRIYKSFHLPTLLALLVIDIAYFLFSYWFFNRGLKRYESGNLITTKL